jgi:hypothetical protein
MVIASIGTRRGEIKIIQAMAPPDKQVIQMMVDVSSSGMLDSHKGGKKISHTKTLEQINRNQIKKWRVAGDYPPFFIA